MKSRTINLLSLTLMMAISAAAADEITVADLSKVRLESGTKELVKASQITDPQSLEDPQPPGKVAPGDVTWHADFFEACQAARDTGKPVLLFHLLGQLDEKET